MVANAVVTFKLEPHNFRQTKSIPWPICSSCGLVRLRNPFTDWSVKMGCNSADHPDFAVQRRRTGEVAHGR
jgi:hypothetical protein